MKVIRALLSTSLVALAQAAHAGPVYMETIDTSSLRGTQGSMDFNFNPGPLNSLGATVTLSHFSSDGTLTGAPSIAGQVAGSLPGSVAIDNGAVLNDYFQQFGFGSAISFTIGFSGPAVDAPDATATSGSIFAFSLFSDAAGTLPALTSDNVNGFAETIAVNLDGSTTRTSFLSNATNTVPEPGTLSLVWAALMIPLGRAMRARRTRLAVPPSPGA